MGAIDTMGVNTTNVGTQEIVTPKENTLVGVNVSSLYSPRTYTIYPGYFTVVELKGLSSKQVLKDLLN